ncbi:MAG: L,D-transpeptidase, partial [Novosphingobium sp.]|nr:L,D-transpeptidase [Novosphingobium sp.]
MNFRAYVQHLSLFATAAAGAIAAPALAQTAPVTTSPVQGPTVLLPPTVSQPVIQETPAPTPPPPPPHWPRRDALVLLSVIQGLGAEGLDPKDYEPATLAAAIASGEGPALNEVATRLFAWVVEDMRDGRTPMTARVQWFAVDPDRDVNPTALVLARALEQGNVAGEIAALAPTHPDYTALKQELASGTGGTGSDRALIRANMDRWRWLARDMGKQYLLTNVPEYMLRLTVNNKVIT